jgi:hypothetical protein
VQIGAILTLAGQRKAEGDDSEVPRKYARRETAGFLSGASRVLLDVLGQSLLDRTIGKLRDFGTSQPTVIAEGAASSPVLPSHSAKTSAFIAAWETAVSRYVQLGAEFLLLLRVNAYSDLDYCELLQFHLDKQSSLTQVYGPTGSLDVALVNAALLRNAKGAYRRTLSTLIPEQERFFYRGYINRLSKPQDFRKLVEDGLYGRCGLRPVGIETADGVWSGPGAHVESSAVISSPAFIGAGSRIAACCNISGASSIERNCEIDCGTVVDQSCILQDAYVGVGLDVRHSIVSNKKLFHLNRNIEVGIADRRLIGAARPIPFVPGAGPVSGASYNGWTD